MADSDLTVVPGSDGWLSTVSIRVPESSKRCYLSALNLAVFHVRVPESMCSVYLTSVVHEPKQSQKRRFP